MTAYTGTILSQQGFGRQDTAAELLAKVSWTSNLSTSDTLTIANAIPAGLKLEIADFEIWGTIPDSNATQQFGLKVGTENDDDAFLVATVINQRAQLFLKGNGAALTTAIDDDEDIVITPTANPATGVSSGDFYVKLTGRLLMK